MLAAQGLEALSDARSAALFLERGDRRRQERRRRREYQEPNESAAQFVRGPRSEAELASSVPALSTTVSDSSSPDVKPTLPIPENTIF